MTSPACLAHAYRASHSKVHLRRVDIELLHVAGHPRKGAVVLRVPIHADVARGAAGGLAARQHVHERRLPRTTGACAIGGTYKADINGFSVFLCVNRCISVRHHCGDSHQMLQHKQQHSSQNGLYMPQPWQQETTPCRELSFLRFGVLERAPMRAVRTPGRKAPVMPFSSSSSRPPCSNPVM